jgi:hypothetical protein
MEASEYFAQFGNLEDELVSLEEEVGSLEQEIKDKKFIRSAVMGLQRQETPGKEGKYGPSFFFVEGISPRNIHRSENPVLFFCCPDCGKEQPVIQRYEQTFDGPEGDVWESEAFIVCEDRVYSVYSYESGNLLY